MFGPAVDNGPVGERVTWCNEWQKESAVRQLHCATQARAQTDLPIESCRTSFLIITRMPGKFIIDLNFPHEKYNSLDNSHHENYKIPCPTLKHPWLPNCSRPNKRPKTALNSHCSNFFKLTVNLLPWAIKLLLRSIGEPGEFWTYSSSLSVLLCFFQLGRKLNSANFLGQEGSLAGSTGSSSLAWLPRLAPKVSTKSCCTLGYRGSPPLVRSSLVRILLFEL